MATVTVREFHFWCVNCPTRVVVRTEVPPSSETVNGPQYAAPLVDGVALCRAHAPRPGDDGLERADLCPACGAQLRDTASLVRSRDLDRVVDHVLDESAAHAEWRDRAAGLA